MVNISFPGLGIDAFSVNKVAFTLPIGNGVEVRWYGIIITLGILLAILYSYMRSKQEGFSTDDLLDMAIFTVVFGIIGARLYYVLFSLGEYDSFLDVISIWNGGLAIYGGLIAGALTIFFVCKYKKKKNPNINALKAFDMVAPAVMIGQMLGRWGNFFNGEAHGGEVLEGEFLYFLRMGLSHGEGASISHFYHPTFLYESLWNLVGFIIINALYKKKKFDGQIVLMYVTWYGFGRMLIEGLRTDSLYLGVFRVSQIVGFICFVAGAILLAINFMRSRRAELTSMEYESMYSKAVDVPVAQGAETLTDEEQQTSEEEESEEEDAAAREADISDRLKNLFDK